MLPLVAVGGGIGGLVYQFSPSTSKSEVDNLEEVLKDIDFATADKEFLKEKAKELADYIASKKTSIESLSAALKEVDKTKETLAKEIKEKEDKSSKLDEEINQLLESKRTKETRQKVATDQKTKTNNKLRSDKEQLSSVKHNIKTKNEWKVARERDVENYSNKFETNKKESSALSETIEVQNKYTKILQDYKAYRQTRNIFYYASGWGIKTEDFSYEPEKLAVTINKKLAITSEIITKKNALDHEAAHCKTLVDSNTKELETTKQEIETEKKNETQLTQVIGDAEKTIAELTSELTELDTTIKQAASNISSKSSEKESLTKELTPIKATLQETTLLANNKASQLSKEQEDLAKLKSLSTQILEKNKDNAEIFEMFKVE